MTTPVMINWLQRFDQEMITLKRKILLFLDNSTSHAHLDLDNIKLIFFPKYNEDFSTFGSKDNPKFQNFLPQVCIATPYCESGWRLKYTRLGKAN